MAIPVDLLERGARQLGITLLPDQISRFELYADLLVEWNRMFNLTRITEPEEMVTKHFLDSLTCLSAIDFSHNARVMDVGTGPGVPGIPLKIVRPDISLVLLDSVRKKLTFLDEVVRMLQLTDVKTVHARAEDVAHDPTHRERYEVVTARALGKLHQLAELCLPLARTGGVVLAMKGPDVGEEVEESRRAIGLLGGKIEPVVELAIPETDISRNIVVLKKHRPTPKRYPRSPAEIERSPL